MSKNLVIVESPAKAKTIEKFLGSDFHVLSSQGHIRDIEALGKNSMGIDFEHNYAPNYVIDPKKQHLLDELRRESDKAETVWLASDEDREGEAIAWHLKEVLQLDPKKTKRIVFHEITKTAIQQAIQHPRDIDYHLVDAQQARRVLDRIVGFELSPILWKKVTTGLSAGRVQSVAVRLIVEREREIKDFATSSHYRITADFTGRNPATPASCIQRSTIRLPTRKTHSPFWSNAAELRSASRTCSAVRSSARRHRRLLPLRSSRRQPVSCASLSVRPCAWRSRSMRAD